MEKNKPADVIRDGNLKATIWANQGENGLYFTSQLAKTFTDRQGAVRDTSSFNSGELLRVAELSRRAYNRSGELREAYKRNFNPTATGQPIYQSDPSRPAQNPQGNLPYGQAQTETQAAPAQTAQAAPLPSQAPQNG